MSSESTTPSAGAHKRPFVLLHGAWHGAWCWERVTPRLEAAGHTVLAPCYPGMGERVGELTPEIGLQRLIDEMTETIAASGLRDVVLVGHSFGGWVIAGVADRLAGAIGQLVFLDANFVRDRTAPFDTLSAEIVASRRAAAALSPGGLTMPAPEPAAFGISDANDAAWVAGRLTPHPLKTYEDRLELAHPLGNGLPKTYIACVQPAFASAAAARERARTEDGWNYIEIATGHDAMVMAPELLTDTLLELAEHPPGA